MSAITEITREQATQFFGHLPSYCQPDDTRVMVEVHLESGQVYTRTIANYERTRRMAASMGMLDEIDSKYKVYRVVP